MGMVFENRNRIRVEELYDDDDDSKMNGEYVPDNDDTYDDESDAEYNTDDEVDHNAPHDPQDAVNIAGVDSEDESENAGIEVEEDTDNDNAPGGSINDDNDDGDDSYKNVTSEEDPDIGEEKEEEDFNDSTIPGVEHNNEEIEDETTSDQEPDHGIETQEDIMDNKYGQRSGRYELRPRKQRDCSHLFATKCDALQKSDRQTQEKHQMPSKISTCKPVTHCM